MSTSNSPVYSPITSLNVADLAASSPPYDLTDPNPEGNERNADSGTLFVSEVDQQEKKGGTLVKVSAPKGPMSNDDLETLRIEYLIPDEVETRVPSGEESVTNPPEGYFALYEQFVKETYLWFPIPSVLIEFARAYNLCLTQFTPNSIRAILGIIVRCFESEVPLSLDLLRLLFRVSPSARSIYYFVAPKTSEKTIIVHLPNKDSDWSERFFFVRQDAHSLGEHYSTYSSEWGKLDKPRTRKDPPGFDLTLEELSKHGCSWNLDFSLARVMLARSPIDAPLTSLDLQHLPFEEFVPELRRRIAAKTRQLDDEINPKLFAKGLKRSVVLGQPAASTSLSASIRAPKKTSVPASKASGSNAFGQNDGSFDHGKRVLRIMRESHQFELSQNDSLRSELEKEKAKSKRLELEVERLRRSAKRRRNDSDGGSSSQGDAEMVPLAEMIDLEKNVERRFRTVNKRFSELMDKPLRAFLRLQEIDNNIDLVKKLMSDSPPSPGAELEQLLEERKEVEDAQTIFIEMAKAIPPLLKIERK